MVSSVSDSYDSLTAIMQQLQQSYQKANTDSTGGLSEKEFSLFTSNVSSSGITDSSFLETLQDNFDQIDTNNNGEISENEIGSYLSAQNTEAAGSNSSVQGEGARGGASSSDDEDSTEEVVYAQEGEDVSPITTDDNGNIVFRTVIKLTGSGAGSNEMTPSLSNSLTSISDSFDFDQGMSDFLSKQYESLFGAE